MITYSPAIRTAMHLAARAHAGQIRKGTGDVPYLVHPQAVACLLAGYRAGEHLIVCGFVHDVPEDTSVTLDDLGAALGVRVARTVSKVTKQGSPEPGESVAVWVMRSIGNDPDATALKAADLCCNLVDLLADGREHGVEYFDSVFKKGAKRKLDGYFALAELLCASLRRGSTDFGVDAERLAEGLADQAGRLRDLVEG